MNETKNISLHGLRTFLQPLIRLINRKAESWEDLKGKPFGSKIEEVKLVDNVSVTLTDLFGGGIPAAEFYVDLVEGQIYYVIYDGVTYKCESVNVGRGDIYIGNSELVGNPFQVGNGEPFLIGANLIAGETLNSTHTITITTKEEVIKKLDEKYLDLPSGILTISNYLETTAGMQKGNGEVFNNYDGNYAEGYMSHAEGSGTEASGEYSHAEGLQTEATGECCHAEGYQSKATNAYDHAEGYKTEANGPYSHAEGQETEATAQASHSEGYQTHATTPFAHAEGSGAQATGVASHAEGTDTIASGTGSHAEGESSRASGRGAHAEGYETRAIGDYSHAEGIDSESRGSRSHAEGYSTMSIGNYSHAEGARGVAIGSASHVEGLCGTKPMTITGTDTSGKFTYNWGYGLPTVGSYLEWDSQIIVKITEATAEYIVIPVHSSGSAARNVTIYEQVAAGDYSHAEGQDTKALKNCSHAEGNKTIAAGSSSHAEGSETKAAGFCSHAEGGSSIAGVDYSHAEGQATKAYGNSSHAEGSNTEASGQYSHAEGDFAKSIGESSHAEGYSTDAIGKWSHTEGNSTIAVGTGSHAENKGFAIGGYSHSEGYGDFYSKGLITGSANATTYTCTDMSWVKVGAIITVDREIFAKIISYSDSSITVDKTLSRVNLSNKELLFCYGVAYGNYSHVEGQYNDTIGIASHAEGTHTVASGDYSHAEGYQTIASGDRQHVQGKYNISSAAYAHIVGNGDSDTSRSNAHTLDWDGNGWYQGSVCVGGINGDAPAASLGANGLVLTDETTGAKYRVYISNGELAIATI